VHQIYKLGIGDWGLGIGPIPNPQSPIPIIFFPVLNKIFEYKIRLVRLGSFIQFIKI